MLFLFKVYQIQSIAFYSKMTALWGSKCCEAPIFLLNGSEDAGSLSYQQLLLHLFAEFGCIFLNPS